MVGGANEIPIGSKAMRRRRVDFLPRETRAYSYAYS